MGSSASKSTTGSSKLVKARPGAVPRIPVNSGPADHQQNHIPIDRDLIDYDLQELPQNAYAQSGGKEKDAGLRRITYFPSGFTVGTVLRGDFSEIHDPDGGVRRHDRSQPERTVVHVEFCNPDYGGTSHVRRRGRPTTRGEFAKFVAEEIQKIIAGRSNFPYTLDEIKVLSIDVRSRETVQPRIFVKYVPGLGPIHGNRINRRVMLPVPGPSN